MDRAEVIEDGQVALAQWRDPFEFCAKIAELHAASHMKRAREVRARGFKTEAIGYETMAAAARQVADDIRNAGAAQRPT